MFAFWEKPPWIARLHESKQKFGYEEILITPFITRLQVITSDGL